MEPADYKQTVPPAIHCYLLCTVLRPSFRVISYTTLNDRVAPNEVASTRSELVLKGLPMFGPSVRGNAQHLVSDFYSWWSTLCEGFRVEMKYNATESIVYESICE